MSDLGKLLMSRPNKKIYQKGSCLIKVFNHNLVSKADVLAEAEIQSRIENTGLDIPKIQEVFKEGDDWCISSDFIEGKTMQELMDENPDKEDVYLEQFLDLQIKMHAISVPKLPGLTAKFQEKISSSKGIVPATTRYELHMSLDSMPKHEKLCHCDFNPTNIILGKDDKYYITDWAHACKGNGSADVAITYMWFGLSGREDLAKKYIAMFCKKTDTAIQYVQKWMPIVAAGMIQNYEGKEREYLLKATGVAYYE